MTMMHRALALALLCQAAHGTLFDPTTGGNDPADPADPANANKNDPTECKDGEDCTPTSCSERDKEEPEETCKAPSGAVLDVMNPRGKNRRAALVNSFCVEFNTPSDTQGFAACPGIYDNIEVKPSTNIAPWTDDPINPLTGDNYLWLRDGSGGSLACGTGAAYVGDWTPLAAPRCRDMCFDVRLIHDGCHSGMADCTQNGTGYYKEVFPYIVIQGGPPTHYRAAFRANDFMTDDDGSSPGWRRICAPLAPLNDAGELPSNDFGYWYMATPSDVMSGGFPIGGPPSLNAAWPALLSDIVAVQLPIDFTGNPAERAGYDSICVRDRDCVDPCDPAPLCHWQNEWDCGGAKGEEWYANFTALVAPVATFPKKPCLCKMLKECCADLCDMAEQEFAALLLNVASGRLALDCGVEWCDDCKYNITSVIDWVDDLLAPSSRGDYDCSRALHVLTGINHDEILCDTPSDPDPCPQTDECFFNDGTCVPVKSCVPSPTVACETHFCGVGTGDVCTCKMANPCPLTPKCKDNGGRCVKNCVAIPGVVDCEDLCSPEGDNNEMCMCEIKVEPCQQTTLCKANEGVCVKEEDCAPPFQCVSRLCNFGDGCVCKIEDPLPCKPVGDSCQKFGGECVKDCFPIQGLRKCDEALCSEGIVEPDGCQCKFESCSDDRSGSCKNKGGTCRVFDDCNPTGAVVCDRSLCGNGDKCVCEYRESPCEPTKQCRTNNGVCVKKEDCAAPFVCKPELCNFDEGCVCKIKDIVLPCEDDAAQSCAIKGGTCKVFEDCNPFDFTCDRSLCGISDKCVCEYKKGPCETTEECADNKGVCVKEEDCATPFVCDPELCDFDEGCVCKIEDPLLPCKDDEDQSCAIKGGTCKVFEDCNSDVFTCDRSLCGISDKCVCEYRVCKDDKNESCKNKGGTCKEFDDCDSAVSTCDPILCGTSDKCVCEYGKSACEPTEQCADNNGECVKKEDCAAPFRCEPEFCNLEVGCVCKIEDLLNSCKPVGNSCQNKGGECVTECVSVVNARKCKKSWCSREISGPGTCQCKFETCKDVDRQCGLSGGTCKVFDDCDPDVSNCDPSLCGKSVNCVCELFLE